MNPQALGKLIEAMKDITRWKIKNYGDYYTLLDTTTGCSFWYSPLSQYVKYEGVDINCREVARVLIGKLEALHDSSVILKLEKHYE